MEGLCSARHDRSLACCDNLVPRRTDNHIVADADVAGSTSHHHIILRIDGKLISLLSSSSSEEGGGGGVEEEEEMGNEKECNSICDTFEAPKAKETRNIARCFGLCIYVSVQIADCGYENMYAFRIGCFLMSRRAGKDGKVYYSGFGRNGMEPNKEKRGSGEWDTACSGAEGMI